MQQQQQQQQDAQTISAPTARRPLLSPQSSMVFHANPFVNGPPPIPQPSPPPSAEKSIRRVSTSESGGHGMTIFFKVQERVKKVNFDELNNLFLERFTDLARHDLRPFYVIDRDTRLQYEIDSVSDLYPNCVLELKGLQEQKKRAVGYGLSGLQRDTIVFVMVGLPARGKSYIAHKVARYLKWLGISTRVFNVGEYRRKKIGAGQDAHFFDPDNKEARKARQHMAIAALDDMLNWLRQGGKVAIYDATNSSKERRKLLLDRCGGERVKVVFIESLCFDQTIIEKNIRDSKVSNPDYVNMPAEKAIEDFRTRIAQYERTYETIDEEHLSYIKLIDVGKTMVANNINNYIAGRVVFFLMNLHIGPRPIYISRHGQSEFNTLGKLGGNSDITDIGDKYARSLADWLADNTSLSDNIVVWTSTLKRTIQTAQYIPLPKLQLRPLDEIDAGDCDGMTYDEIAERMPEEWMQRAADKLRYRYPRGESYVDLIERLEPIIFELERQKNPVLVVSHQATIRCLYAYFMNHPAEEIPHLSVPLHTLIALRPGAYGTAEKRYKLIDDVAVDK